MRRSEKVWVIDVDNLRDRVRRKEAADAQRGQERLRLHVGSEKNRTGRLFLGAYALGPLAPVVQRQGQGSVVWGLLGVLGLSFWGMTLWRWSDLSYRLESGQIPFGLWLGTLGFLTVAAGLAWARALWLAGRDSRFFADGVPRWLASPLPAGILGVLLPGSGLLLVGASRRAAGALLGFLTMLISVAVLVKSQWLWHLNGQLLAGSIEPRRLEQLFLAAGGLAFAGGMIWVASVLDGMRCGLRVQGGAKTGLGDWMTFLLLVVLIATYAASEPRSAARDVHNYSTALEGEGMQLVPLQLARLAVRLDPARPRYAMHLASLLQNDGKMVDAEILREQTRSYWQEYEHLVERQNPDAPGSTDAVPIAPDSVIAPLDSLGTPGLVQPESVTPTDSSMSRADSTATPTGAAPQAP